MTTRSEREPSGDRQQQVSRIIEDVIRRRLAGEELPDEAVIKAHPQLMPELGEMLRGLKRVQDARQLADVTVTGPVSSSDPAERVGPYRILNLLGEGGFGIVYLAEQQEPIRRRVALKLIKPGMDSKAVIGRFEAERQALAIMDHPNVAKVFDAGTTDQGRPYFVMEHVAGVPITDHCDRHNLSIEQRLELFGQICEAIQHAHQKGVIHRDIKPSNILVAYKDDKAIPKVIDFGVAKAIEQRLSERTVFTEQGQLVGTPAYMSPEQAEATAQDVDTRTDIYSLGVLLYELLTGMLPFDPRSLRRAAFEEFRRIIREVDPSKPSTKLSSMASGSAGEADGPSQTTAIEIARHRHTDLRSLARCLRGDLDWITMKALEKDRVRRYASASDFAADIRRHLRHEVVVASPPSAAYRARKFVRRNRALVTGAVAVLVVLLAGIIATTAAWRDAVKARAEAQRQATIVEAVNDFLVDDMLASADPKIAQGRKITVEEVLANAAAEIGTAFAEEPEIRASLQLTMGKSYMSLGLYEQAGRHFQEAEALFADELGEEHRKTLLVTDRRARLLALQGMYQEAEKLGRSTLEVQRRTLGSDHPDTLRTMNNLADAIYRQRKYAEAEELWRKTLESRSRVLGDEHEDTLLTMNNLATALWDQGKYPEAEALFRETLEIQHRVLGDNHPDVAITMSNLGAILAEQRRLDEAETLCRQTLAKREELLGDDHPDTLQSRNNLGGLLFNQGKYAEAQRMFADALSTQRRQLGEDHPSTLQSLRNLALALEWQGKYAEAEPVYVDVIERCRRRLEPDHPDTVFLTERLGDVLRVQGKLEDARPYVSALISHRRRIAERPDAKVTEVNAYARELLTCEPQDLRDAGAALAAARKAASMPGGENPKVLGTLALALQMTGDIDQAIATQERAIALLPEGASPLRTELEERLRRFLEIKNDVSSQTPGSE